MLHDVFRTHTLTVERRVRVSDGAHGWTQEFAPIGTVTGSLQPGSAAETAVAAAEQADVRWVLYLDPGAVIAPADDVIPEPAGVKRDDELTIAGHPRLRVIAVLEHLAAGPLDHARVDLVEVQHGN